jgi:hypothetical protein
MKLQQNQVWKHGDGYLRIVRLARLEVQYKQMADLTSGDGTHHTVTKKTFCRMLKTATLLTPDQIPKSALRKPPPPPTTPA